MPVWSLPRCGANRVADEALQVDLVIDFVCPWCWLGFRNWQKARNLMPETSTETVLRPHELDPAIPAQGLPYKAYMQAKFAGENAERWAQMREHLEAAAPEAGIEFRFGEIEHRPSTVNAHRLIRWARGQGNDVAEAIADKLFSAYFRELKDIGDPAVLIEIGTEAGMDRTILTDLFATDRDINAVRDEAMFFARLGVNGVPTYIFNGKFAVPGAVAPDTLVEASKEALSDDS